MRSAWAEASRLAGRPPAPGALASAGAVALDVATVLVFVGVGRSVHRHGLTVAGMASTTWPFVTGLAVGWFVLLARHRPGRALGDGIVVVVATVAVGMALRVVGGQGTALAFVLVALAFLGLAMLGWRLVAGAVRPIARGAP